MHSRRLRHGADSAEIEHSDVRGGFRFGAGQSFMVLSICRMRRISSNIRLHPRAHLSRSKPVVKVLNVMPRLPSVNTTFSRNTLQPCA
jgi:hypothetical protein